MDILNGLNDSQREAVVTTEGPVMVMAGAGSGKTKVLTTRISYLISELGIPMYSILAVTFTNKAALEMKNRIANMLNCETKQMWISTFHSFCARFLRLEIEALPGYTKYFNIIDEEDSLKIIKEILKDEDFDDKPKDIKNLISKSKNFNDFTIKDPHRNNVFTHVSRIYEERLKKENLLDFDDLIIKTVEILTKNPDILERYQRRFQYILVDEFQDTNYIQYKLMMMLALRHHNLFVVGDDFQSIYSFRGAKIENINKLRKDFIETKLILLEKNYRSTTQILDLANCVIENNPNQIKKTMTSNDYEGVKPMYYHADGSFEECLFVIDKIKQLVNRGDEYKDFAIMYRANYISRNFEDLLVRNQIPYKIYGGLSFFARKEIKDMVAYLRVLVHPTDDFSFRRIINEPKRKIGDAIISKLQMKADDLNESLYNSIPSYEGGGIGATNLREFYSVMEVIKGELNNIELPKIIDILLERTGYELALKNDDDYAERLDNIKEFKSVLKETEEIYEGLDNNEILEHLLSDLALRSENDDTMEDNAVRLTTYHQAKGLEFKNVFMVATEEGIFPSMNSQTNEEIEEERRICYVGITRAKERLFITNCEQRFMFGHQTYMLPSRFIREMDSDLYDDAKKPAPKKAPSKKVEYKKSVETKKEEPKNEEVRNLKGAKISHKVFGDGVVVSQDGEKVRVAFKSPHGIKVLNYKHPSVTILD